MRVTFGPLLSRMVSVDLRRDAGLGMWMFSNRHVSVGSYGDLIALRHIVGGELRRVPPRASILVCLDGFTMDPRFAEAYGRLVKEFMHQSSYRVGRYGGSLLATTRMQLAAKTGGFASQVFRTREDAIHALRWLSPTESGAAPIARSPASQSS
jgi:hypothetical protein